MMLRGFLILTVVSVACDAFTSRHNVDESNKFFSTRSKVKHDFAEDRSEAIFRDHLLGQNSLLRYDCTGCLSDDGTGEPKEVRVMFIESKDIVENSKAEESAKAAGTNYDCGSCCSDPERAHPECFVPENWSGGWIAKPVTRILHRTGAKIVAMTSANLTAEAASLSFEKHPFALCPVEILLGNVDVCVGDWWETLSRRTQVRFSTPLDINHFKLVTLAKDPEGFKPKRLLEMFQPFSGTVWGGMLGMFLFAALVFWILNEECEDFDESETFPHPKGFAKGLWVAAMGYFAGNQFEVMTWPGRVVLLGYSFFLATCIAAYTANLASFMVQKQADLGAVTSLNDIVMRGKSLCVVPDIAKMMTEPGILERTVVVDSGFMGSMFELMLMGVCDAALVGKMEYLLYAKAENMQYDICTTESDPNYGGGFYCVNEGSSMTRYDLTKCQCGTDSPLDVPAGECPSGCVAPHTKFCNVIEILDPTLRASLNYGLPTADWFESYLSAGIIAAKLSGEFAQDYKAELTDQNAATCPSDTAQSYFSDSDVLGRQAQSLNVYQMAGTFLIGFIFMVVGVLLHLKDLFWPDHNKVMPADQEFLDESVRRRTEWEAAAGSKFKSVSPGASPGPTLREAGLEREGSEAFSAANTLAQAPSQGDHSVRPALAESDLGERGKDGVVVVNAGESHEAGWVVGPRAGSSPEQLEEAGKAVAQRGAELEMITQALQQVMAEVQHIKKEGMVTFNGSMRGKTTSGGAGSSFRKRQGR